MARRIFRGRSRKATAMGVAFTVTFAFDPSKSRLQAIFDADVAAGGTSYWFDRILARPFLDASGEDSLMTRGRALFMYTHDPSALGFVSAGATRQRSWNLRPCQTAESCAIGEEPQ
jgi:hypothetical protein